MTSNNAHGTSLEENTQDTSQSASSITGLSSYTITNGYHDLDLEESRDEIKSGIGVDQGVASSETPHALYTTDDDTPRTGYEPKPSSTRVVGGALNQHGRTDSTEKKLTSTTSVHRASWESGKAKGERITHQEACPDSGGPDAGRDYGSELVELEEKIQHLAIKEETHINAIHLEMTKVSRREEVESIQKALMEVLQCLNDRFKDYVMADEIENLVRTTTGDLK